MRLALAAALLFSFAWPVAPQTNPAKLPAHDSHQGILVACDAYRSPKRAKKTFGKENPVKAGILPVEVYIRNSTRWPVAVKLGAVRLEVVTPGSSRDQLDPMSAGDVARDILHPKPASLGVPRPRLPIPIPEMGRGGKWRKLRDKLQELSFPAAVVAPGATVHGFFYFDLAGDFDALRYARFYVPDMKFLGNTQPIMFFEADFHPSGSQ
jgi:hypothetical protein